MGVTRRGRLNPRTPARIRPISGIALSCKKHCRCSRGRDKLVNFSSVSLESRSPKYLFFFGVGSVLYEGVRGTAILTRFQIAVAIILIINGCVLLHSNHDKNAAHYSTQRIIFFLIPITICVAAPQMQS